ncbi:MAG: DNA replication and repair protein RecF [Acidobacteria bacterium]|nr:DNA replication and repair protein RecF [Acidobacteriota bacterium]
MRAGKAVLQSRVMELIRIEATGFRNLTGAADFAPGLNILHGANAQGKTSWLEAISLLASTKSFRTTIPREALCYGESEALLRGSVVRGTLKKELLLHLTSSSKQTYLNGKREATASYLGNLVTVAFTADELDVVRGAPEARRRFLDRGIFSIHPAYLGTLTGYNRVLKQKNALLRQAVESRPTSSLRSLIETWNDQLVLLGTEIQAARVNYVERLTSAIDRHLFQAEEVEVRYRSSLEAAGDSQDYAKLLRERLELRLPNELSVGYSLVGPHRDDLEILADGRETARFGSSGQQRSALLILDLAQLNVYYRTFEEYPVFLIDDLDAELDRSRIEILLDYLADRSQTIVSTSKRSLADSYRNRATRLEVDAGRIRETLLPAD